MKLNQIERKVETIKYLQNGKQNFRVNNEFRVAEILQIATHLHRFKEE